MNQILLKYLLTSVLFSLILFSVNSSAQPLTGIKTIPGNYATVEAAIIDLNLQGVGGGGVTFNVTAGHTETFSTPSAGIIIANGTQSDQIIFQKSGVGANPLITAALNGTTTNADGIIIIAGGDYITFDAIDLQENSGNVDATTQMEWGYALVKKSATAPFDGCRFVTIKNSTITLNKANGNSSGIYSGNHLATSLTSLTLTDSTVDVMRNCKFFSNTISNVSYGINLAGSTVPAFYDRYNEVGVDGGNNISNYGGGSTAAYGMELEYQNNFKVANNIVNGGGPTHTGTLYGIRTGSATNANIDIYNNTVTIEQGGSSIMYGITNSTGSTGVDNTVNIYNNIIENCLHPVSTGNNMWLLYNLASAFNLNIYGNIIRNNTKTAGTGVVYCILNSPVSAAANARIYDNQIYNNSSGGAIHGINTNAGANNLFYGNKIYDLRSTSSATTLVVAGITIASGPISTNIYNNFISDLKAPNSTSPDAIRGINLATTTANSNIGLYYNTVFLNAIAGGGNFGTAGIYHSNSTTATTAVLDMRNNIVVNNSVPNGTGKTSAFRRSLANANLNNYSTLSNNNSFYAGTPGTNNVIFFDGTNFDQTLSAFKTRVAPRESNTFTEYVPFVNNTTAPYDLHVRTDVATQTEGSGTPITTPIAVATDIDGDGRNGTLPDVGADEFNGMGSDITPPFISYTTLAHTTSTANRNLDDAVITDGSGVNTTPGTAPRIYFKRVTDNNTFVDNTSSTNGWKYVESISGSTPFDFVINYSLLFGGTGVQSGVEIQYFVVAQDLFNPANVGISEGTFAVMPASVNLTAAAFPLTGTINSYRIYYLLNGNYTVGTGGNYPNLTGPTGFFNLVNENILSGNVTAQVIGDITEPGTVALNQWVEDGAGNFTLTIQPNAAVVRNVSGSTAGGLIKLNGADRVTIDGRFNGTGNYLAIQNTNTATNTAAIHLLSLGVGAGATNNTIRNCNIKAGTNSVTSSFGIYVGGATISTTGSGTDNNNITISNNIISKCRFGLYLRGTAGNPLNNLVITGNTIGSNIVDEYITEYGINIQAAVAPQVTYNEVLSMISDVSKWGIFFGSNVSNAVVSKNRVHSFDQPGQSGFNSVGIYFSSATGCTDNQIDNNMIYNLNTYGNTSMYLVGIRIVGGTNYKIYYNSISMTGAIGNPGAGMVSSCIYISTATTNADIRNNILLNTRTGLDQKNYTIHSPNTTTFANLNHNDYWTTGNVIGYFGADVANFADWKTVVGQDLNSKNIDPMFTSTTNLHINAGTTPTLLESGGALIAGITTDIDNDVRPGPVGSVNGGALAPDLGADEFDGVPVAGATFEFSLDVYDGWNMVSVPGLHPVNQNVGTWWPNKNPLADVYKWTTAYVPVTTTTPREGYWMLHSGAQTYNYSGIIFVTHDPIPVNAGWSMIGGYENSASVAGLTTTPPGLIVPNTVYGWNGTYFNPTNLEPGYGYWILTNGAGVINPPTLAKGTTLAKEEDRSQWGKITITDATGKHFTLYSVNEEVNLDHQQMPPLPPTGAFDVRYASNRKAENLKEGNQSIEMRGMVYPVTVRVENANIRLQDETGKTVNARLKSGEEITINSNQINKLLVSENIIPDVYALEQNYPNPFNPSTVIEFSIPEDAVEVRLTIYNALGQRVTELVNTKLEAGQYKYQWDASDVASGLYIYELRTSKYTSIKKMMLMK